MNTITTTAPNHAILAIDLGKYKSVVCIYDKFSNQAQFESVTTMRLKLVEVIQRYQPGVVIIEACALCGWVHDLCVELGVAIKVANTAAEAWKFKNTKRKTDRDDALKLAQLEALGQLPTVPMPKKHTREWRALIAYRQTVVGRRVAVQNRIRSIFVGQGMAAPTGARAWTRTGMAGMAQYAKPLSDCLPNDLWQGLLDLALKDFTHLESLIDQVEAKLDALGKADPRVQLLDTVPGMGPRTAEAVTAYLDNAQRFATGKQVSAYAGLVPKQFQSGETDRRGRITRRGPALLRKLLVECAWCSLRYNAWARRVYLRLSGGGKVKKKQAIVALARKILVRAWAMLRDGTAWRGEPMVEVAAT